MKKHKINVDQPSVDIPSKSKKSPKQFFKKIIKIIKKIPLKRVAAIGLPLALGILIGWSVTYFSMRNDKGLSSRQKDAKTSITGLSNEDLQKRTTDQVKRAYDRVQERVKTDLESNTLTKEQAAKITQKQKEIYDFRKSLKQDSEDDQKKLSEKRTELRKWMQDNKISAKYFSGLY